MDIPIVETERLRLRGFVLSDFEELVKLNMNQDFVNFFGTGEVISRYESWNVLSMMVGHWQLREFGLWLVEDKISNTFIGRVGCWQPEGWPGVEVAWGISPSYWGKGYAPEAARASIEWAFSNISTNKLISVIHPENKASKRVAIKIGEKHTSTEIVNGKKSDIYTITRD
ncbi:MULTISPECIES: GNAT family N-acetyltransferase [unclassified Oceanispirochaeta]|uniref:GNAT family N-acetyltransferase n=1 Tax=unclassified Oceanispirochaeta TaxID=2635722 RepID=UPI001313EB2B|nr:MULTISPECIES: GNAT family N-acetyltransferase [unclassified Oceanispirochaeta]MBF9018265.1 GNAT family N-acetyltransferase [Oceanispirochaeta sp. M2]NPD74730.1 GNAT family N-acetyltransferase [Oceanispirochaeta sp. M1]